MAKIAGSCALLIAILHAGAAAAFDGDGRYTVHGSGASSCRDWVIDRRIDDAGAWQLQQWVLGYLTAYNEWVRGKADIVEGLDAEGALAWIDTYCGGELDRTLGDALGALVHERAGITAE